jgi:hypothetical protein
MSRTLTLADEMMMVRRSVAMKQKISVTDIAHVPSVELRSGIWERSRNWLIKADVDAVVTNREATSTRA